MTANKCSHFFRSIPEQIKHECTATWDAIRHTQLNLGFLFAVICVFLVIVGNIIILISVNFWIQLFPADSLVHNSSQIAIQVVSVMFIVIFFTLLGIIFGIVCGFRPLWEALVNNDRVYSPWLRLLLLFSSGATNAISSLLGVYSMYHTPEFIQAVLLCVIPFSAQAWTVIFISEERKRNYLSVFFIGSFLFFVAGVLLSSMSAFLTKDNTSGASWEWALIYLLSSIFFGLWCVVQRLYLDGVTKKEENINPHQHNEDPHLSSSGEPVVMEEAEPSALPDDIHMNHNNNETENNNNMKGGAVGTVYSTESDNEESEAELLIMEKRQWASNKTEDNASKVVLLVVGLFFQLFVSFILFPIDAIPWFGTSSTAKEAWTGFQQCFIFIFQSWLNVRYGLLYSLGYAMSFLGCTYLNEHSPTLASVVLQLAGPITSIVILIIPQWNVYQDHGNVGHKVGGVILLFVAALLYHLWEQQSMRDLLAKAEEKKRKRKQSSSSHHTPDHEQNDNHNNDERNEEARVMMVESDRKLNEEL